MRAISRTLCTRFPAIFVLRYDLLNRLITMVDGAGTTIYGYDAVGQLLSEGGLWANDTVSYTYANRLQTGLSLGGVRWRRWFCRRRW